MVVQVRVNRYQRAVAQAQRREMLRTGTMVRFTPSHRCSCLDLAQQAQPGCRVCGGLGWYWVEAEERRIRAIVSDAKLNRMFRDFGMLQQGDLAVVFDPRTRYKAWDRLRLTADNLHQFDIMAESEIITHDEDDADSLVDTVRHRIAQIESVAMADPDTGVVVTYRLGIDFTAPAGDNRIVWSSALGAVQPPPLHKIAVSYYADYDWIALQEAAPRHAGGAGFGGVAFFSRHIADEREADARRDQVYP